MKRIDWHKADIICALHKQRMTLASLSREAGLSSSPLGNALVRPWFKGELIIAQALKITPEIWSSRYFDKNGEFIVRKRRLRK